MEFNFSLQRIHFLCASLTVSVSFLRLLVYNYIRFGALAQLEERLVRNEEVDGSIPLCSTIKESNPVLTGFFVGLED